MAWKKSPPELVATFEKVTPLAEDVESRQMFGYPACFVGGIMFMSLFQDSFVLRLSEDDGAALLVHPETSAFEPMPGRPMRGYVALSKAFVADSATLAAWIEKALAHGRSLPAKNSKKGASAKKPAPARRPSGAKKLGTAVQATSHASEANQRVSSRGSAPPPRGRKQSGTVKKAAPARGR